MVSTKADLASEPIRRVYDVRDLAVSPRGGQSAADLKNRAKDIAAKAQSAIDGSGTSGKVDVRDGQLVVHADLGGQASRGGRRAGCTFRIAMIS